MKIMSNSKWVSRIMLTMRLFFHTFCEKILMFLIIIACCHLQLNELIGLWNSEVPDTFSCATLC